MEIKGRHAVDRLREIMSQENKTSWMPFDVRFYWVQQGQISQGSRENGTENDKNPEEQFFFFLVFKFSVILEFSDFQNIC